MRDTPGTWCRPEDPYNDEFQFVGVSSDGFDPDNWPTTPPAYRPTTHFYQLYRENDRVFSGDIIDEAISSGDIVPALNECGAFYTDKSGVVYYIVVGWDFECRNPREKGERVVVTGWPWVYDRELALDAGFSTRILNRMQSVNETLFNEKTADHDWLDYFESSVSTVNS